MQGLGQARLPGGAAEQQQQRERERIRLCPPSTLASSKVEFRVSLCWCCDGCCNIYYSAIKQASHKRRSREEKKGKTGKE